MFFRYLKVLLSICLFVVMFLHSFPTYLVKRNNISETPKKFIHPIQDLKGSAVAKPFVDIVTLLRFQREWDLFGPNPPRLVHLLEVRSSEGMGVLFKTRAVDEYNIGVKNNWRFNHGIRRPNARYLAKGFADFVCMKSGKSHCNYSYLPRCIEAPGLKREDCREQFYRDH